MIKRFLAGLAAGGLLLAACSPAGADLPPTFTSLPPQATAKLVAPTATASPPPPSATPLPSPETGGGVPERFYPPGDPIKPFAAGQALTITQIAMLTEAAGWAVGRAGLDPDDHILRTADGGQTWREVTPPQPLNPEAPLGQGATVFFLNEKAAWVTYFDRTAAPLVGAAYVWYTTDAGATWTPSAPLDVADGAYYAPSDIVFVDAQTGWLMAHVDAGMMHDYVMIYATQNGGLEWERLVDPFNEKLPMSCGKTALVFADARVGWVTGDCAGVTPGAPYLQLTTDGGRTWQFEELSPPADQPDLFNTDEFACGIYAPRLFSPQQVRLVVQCLNYTFGRSDAFLYATDDGGQSWAAAALPNFFDSIEFLGPDQGWVMTTADPSASGARDIYQIGEGEALTQLKTVNWLGQLNFVNERAGWAVAESAEGTALVQTIDGGATWSVIQPVVAP